MSEATDFRKSLFLSFPFHLHFFPFLLLLSLNLQNILKVLQYKIRTRASMLCIRILCVVDNNKKKNFILLGYQRQQATENMNRVNKKKKRRFTKYDKN